MALGAIIPCCTLAPLGDVQRKIAGVRLYVAHTARKRANLNLKFSKKSQDTLHGNA